LDLQEGVAVVGPLYKFGWFDYMAGLQLAGLIGFLFGFLLERAGFGNPRKLVAIFYLRDFAVLKVMFTAIVVCLLGLLYLSFFGWIDLDRVYLLPTYLWPQIVGGFLLGVGFVMGGYCPTTSVVATVSGRLDGLLFICGMTLGSFVFAEVFPLVERFYTSGNMGALRLPDVLGLNSGVAALMVCILAVLAFCIAETVERKRGDAESLPRGSRRIKAIAGSVMLGLGFMLALINPDRPRVTAPLTKRDTVVEQEEGKRASGKAPEAETPFMIIEDEGC
jgi:uncharacterized membrane protein YedE/YeeE